MATSFSVVSDLGELYISEPTISARNWEGCFPIWDRSLPHHSNVRSKPHEAFFELFSGEQIDSLFLDVGANIGQTVTSLRLVGSKARIYSFEPNALSYPSLNRLAKEFDNAISFNFGLSNFNGTLDIFTPVIQGIAITPLTTTSLDHLFTVEMKAYIERISEGQPVQIFKSFATFMRGDDLNLSPATIKIDVEGAELKVVEGFSQTITNCRPKVVFERNADCGKQLLDFGYTLFVYDFIKKSLVETSINGDAWNSSSEILALYDKKAFSATN